MYFLYMTYGILSLLLIKSHCQVEPVINLSGENLNTETGQTVTLDCDISDVPQTQYKVNWIMKNTIISEGTQMITTDLRKSIVRLLPDTGAFRQVYRLTIAEATPADIGTYTCRLTYSLDNGVSNFFTEESTYVFVIDELPVCSFEVNDVEFSDKTTIAIGSTINFGCEATLKDVSYSLRWYFALKDKPLSFMAESVRQNGGFHQSSASGPAGAILDGSVFRCAIWNSRENRANYVCSIGPLDIVNKIPVITTTKVPVPSASSNPITDGKPTADLPLTKAYVQTTPSDNPAMKSDTTESATQPISESTSGHVLHVVYTFPPLAWIGIAIGTIAFILGCVVLISVFMKWKKKSASKLNTLKEVLISRTPTRQKRPKSRPTNPFEAPWTSYPTPEAMEQLHSRDTATNALHGLHI